MKMKDTETKAEKAMRLAAVDQEQYKTVLKALPKLLLLLLICICMYLYTNNKEKDISVGNPYECMDCKEFNRACKEHKEFDSEKGIKDKIRRNIENYTNYLESSGDIYIYYLYNENWYNTDCDFCSKQKEECSGCSYNRVAILKYINNTLPDTVNSFCNECKELGYAKCNTDINSLVDKVYAKISK